MYIKYLLTIIFILFIEFIWLYLINKKTYSDLTKSIQKTEMKINYLYTIIAYIVILSSIFILSIPFIKSKFNKNDTIKNKLLKALIYGSIVGFYIYGIYNLTSIAIYTNYKLKIALIDTLWGMILYSSASILYIFIESYVE
jgi:uncharacterized membrane protein|tara:strand:- start:2207 stop:2629 length:423 start_codon:yes stop_codon:yes gene_type:complete